MITRKQRALIEALNDMYYSKSVDYRNQCAENYFYLLEYIMNPKGEQEVDYNEIKGIFLGER